MPSINSLNLNVSNLSKSATLAINERCRELRKQGRKIYNFGLGQSPFPVPEPVRKALAENAHQKDYLAVEGLPELRRAIAQYYSNRNGITYGHNQVLIGPGSKELMFLLQLVYYGDLVIPIPSWVSYAPQARIIGRQVQWLPTISESNWMLSAEMLDRHCREDPERPRIVIINYPSNPTGTTLGESHLKEVAEVARKYDVVLLSDEIYSELHYEDNHISIARFYPEGTIISGGLSKWCGAGGWRLGAFMFPSSQSRLLETMSVAASETFTSTCAPVQYAAITAYEGNAEIDVYLRKCRHILKMLGHHCAKVMQSAGISVPLPEGGFYLFPDFGHHRAELAEKSITDNRRLCEYFLEKTGIASLYGSAFGCPASDLSLRMAFVDFDGARALGLYNDFKPNKQNEMAFLKEACPDVLEGVQRLADEVSSWQG
jgi:aspartate aminotransferase